jgi:hypothetical protein
MLVDKKKLSAINSSSAIDCQQGERGLERVISLSGTLQAQRGPGRRATL